MAKSFLTASDSFRIEFWIPIILTLIHMMEASRGYNGNFKKTTVSVSGSVFQSLLITREWSWKLKKKLRQLF